MIILVPVATEYNEIEIKDKSIVDFINQYPFLKLRGLDLHFLRKIW